MKVFVTGAGGFLGSAVVRAVQAAGHEVLALHRPTSTSAVPAGVKIVHGDLRQPGAWRETMEGVDAVVHCAAAASGDLAEQLGGTVLATENLLAALPVTVRRFVHISSFSVYDFDAAGRRGILDETTPLETNPRRRDAYTTTKLAQEKLIVEHAANAKLDLVVLRPGAIYGPGKDWGFGSAMTVGRFDLIFAPLSPMRLVHVDNVADAVVAALSVPVDGSLIVNLVDQEQPSHWRFHRLGKKSGATLGTAIPVPYWMVRALGASARLASRMFFHGRAKLPEMLDPPRLRVRWRPLRYANVAARSALGWSQQRSLAQGASGLTAHKNASAQHLKGQPQ